MPDFGLGGPSFGLRDAKIARWNGDGTYGPMVDVPSVQLMGVNIQTTNAQLEGDDVITDVHAKATSGQVTIRFGSVALEVLEILTDRTIESSGSTPNAVDRLSFTGTNFRWFALCGKAESTNGVGDVHFFVPKCKIMEGFEVRMEYGQYLVPELTAMCVPDDYYVIAGEDEIQTVTVTGTPTGGTFTLTFAGDTTSAIAYNAAASAVDTALEALSTIGTGNVTVSGSAGGPYTVTFVGDFADLDVPLMTADGALLTGGTSPDVTVTQTNAGVENQNIIFDIIEHETAVPVFIPPA